MRILVLGASGMAGHVIAEILKQQHEIVGLTRNIKHPSVDCVHMNVLETCKLSEFILKQKFDIVINCVGLLNKEASDFIEHSIMINSLLPHLLSRLCSSYGGRVIHLSTDCVFSGKDGNYYENSFRDGDSAYDRTKALGELFNENDLTFRMSIVGPDLDNNGIGLFNWFMKQNSTINGYTSFYWSGITTICLAKGILEAINQNIKGLYHLVSNNTITKYELLVLFKNIFNRNVTIIPINEPNINKQLVNSRSDFIFLLPSYFEMVIEMKEWINNHNSWYNHYFI